MADIDAAVKRIVERANTFPTARERHWYLGENIRHHQHLYLEIGEGERPVPPDWSALAHESLIDALITEQNKYEVFA